MHDAEEHDIGWWEIDGQDVYLTRSDVHVGRALFHLLNRGVALFGPEMVPIGIEPGLLSGDASVLALDADAMLYLINITRAPVDEKMVVDLTLAMKELENPSNIDIGGFDRVDSARPQRNFEDVFGKPFPGLQPRMKVIQVTDRNMELEAVDLLHRIGGLDVYSGAVLETDRGDLLMPLDQLIPEIVRSPIHHLPSDL
ncbi:MULTISPECIES: hypothetical protein [unclassified Microbacterium]|uniref:hypothetical protein n=1 Tax=unclassified Microbacterium TaxID=2609290 RepID=UPI0028832919|nr:MULTISPECIES: hypothetical protein [unclassified Microbacterium]